MIAVAVLAAMLLPLMSTGAAAPVLRFADCKSGRPIVLVGCMHYNPVSVALAERVVRELAEEDQLGAVALEVCPSRWDSTLRAQPRGSLLRRICDNEFQAAAEVAEDFSCGLALADQSIEVTSGRLAQLAKLTVVQLFTGEAEAVRRDIGVGWRALYLNSESMMVVVSSKAVVVVGRACVRARRSCLFSAPPQRWKVAAMKVVVGLLSSRNPRGI